MSSFNPSRGQGPALVTVTGGVCPLRGGTLKPNSANVDVGPRVDAPHFKVFYREYPVSDLSTYLLTTFGARPMLGVQAEGGHGLFV